MQKKIEKDIALRIMLDSNVYDKIIISDGLELLLKRLIKKNKVDILSTSVQEEELDRIPDPVKRKKVKMVPRKVIPIEANGWRLEKWEQDPENIKIKDITKGNPKHTNDALIVTTAVPRADVFVTEEKKTLFDRICASANLEVWNFDTFESYIRDISI